MQHMPCRAFLIIDYFLKRLRALWRRLPGVVEFELRRFRPSFLLRLGRGPRVPDSRLISRGSGARSGGSCGSARTGSDLRISLSIFRTSAFCEGVTKEIALP